MLRSGTPETLLEDLKLLNLDLVLLNSPAGRDQSPAFRSHRLFEQHVNLIATPARLAQGGSVIDLLRRHPVILPAPDSSIRIGFDALAQRLGIRPQIIAEADDMAMMRLLAREDVGVAVLPPVVVRDELSTEQLVEAGHLEGVVETFYAITAERKFPNALLAPVLKASIEFSGAGHT